MALNPTIIQSIFNRILNKAERWPEHFGQRPRHDFTGHGKCDAHTLIKLMISIKGCILFDELKHYFGMSKSVLRTASAFIQQWRWDTDGIRNLRFVPACCNKEKRLRVQAC